MHIIISSYFQDSSGSLADQDADFLVSPCTFNLNHFLGHLQYIAIMHKINILLKFYSKTNLLEILKGQLDTMFLTDS